MPKAVKLVDVAKAAGVSQGTASNVFNRPKIVRPEIRERVLSTARAMGYAGPDAKARVLRAGKVNAIGVASAQPISYFFDDPYARVMMSGIADACDERGAGLALVSAINRERIAWNIESALVDGFILYCVEGGPELIRLTKRRRLPFVALDWLDDPTISALGVDDVEGARKAARHLVELGHRRFAILALRSAKGNPGPAPRAELEGLLYHVARERLDGYFEVLNAAGIGDAEVPILSSSGTEDEITFGLAEIFRRRPQPTAILSMSDKFAIVALKWLAENGHRVPDDVSVIGYDGVPESENSSPPLTTIAQPIRQIGRLAVESVLRESTGVQRRLLDTDLIVRGSTAPPPHGRA